jgi:small subunit ribosomal protein S12e
MTEASGSGITDGLRQINLSGRVAKGFNCTVKAIIKGKAKIVILADDCDNNDYKRLITGLCQKNHVKLQPFASKQDLALALGLVQLRANGSTREGKRPRVCGACAVIKYGNVVNTAVEEFLNQLELPIGEPAA